MTQIGHFETRFLTKPKEMGDYFDLTFWRYKSKFYGWIFLILFISDFDHALATHILGFKNRDFC